MQHLDDWLRMQMAKETPTTHKPKPTIVRCSCGRRIRQLDETRCTRCRD